MRQSQDEFDAINHDADLFYKMGSEAGQQQANTYHMDEIKQQGFAFGQELGEQIAFYEQFIKAFEKLQIDPGRMNPKIYPAIAFIKDTIQRLDFTQVATLKSQQKQLKHRFKILVAMVGVKGYEKVKNEEGNVIQEENQGLDF